MKKVFILLALLKIYATRAQLVITPGAQLYVSGNAQLTLQNIDLVNNGSFSAGSGTVSFTGNANAFISGSQPVQFYQLEINKISGSSVLLQRLINITQQINFAAGFLDPNNFNIDLGTSAALIGENESSHITGVNGGQVLFSTVLNAPSAANPANLGAIITSSQNMGNVIIKRGHQSQVNGTGTGSSILRYFDISPANNTALNATIRFQYYDSELNGINENTMVFWKSTDLLTWSNLGFTSRNTASNYVEKAGINSFSRWTLSSVNNPLPVRFILFNTVCDGNNVIVNWKTEQEQNSSHFDIEKSADGIQWNLIQTLPAAGNSSTERSYSFTDHNLAQKNYYRIVQHDISGRVQYTNVLRPSCEADDIVKIWPNPFSEMVFVNIYAKAVSKANIKLFDNKGALVKIQQVTLMQGGNRVSIDMKNFAKAVYQVAVEGGNGQLLQTIKVIKQ